MESLILLLNEIRDKKFTLKQLKNDQVKVQDTTKIYSKIGVVLASRKKNANFYVYQLKKRKVISQ